MTSAQSVATAAYKARVARIRDTMDRGSVAFAVAMTDACAAYESAMVADIGRRRASKLGAGRPRLRGPK